MAIIHLPIDYRIVAIGIGTVGIYTHVLSYNYQIYIDTINTCLLRTTEIHKKVCMEKVMITSYFLTVRSCLY